MSFTNVSSSVRALRSILNYVFLYSPILLSSWHRRMEICGHQFMWNKCTCTSPHDADYNIVHMHILNHFFSISSSGKMKTNLWIFLLMKWRARAQFGKRKIVHSASTRRWNFRISEKSQFIRRHPAVSSEFETVCVCVRRLFEWRLWLKEERKVLNI